MDAGALGRQVIARDRAAIARALNLVEDRRPSARADQRALMRAIAGAPRARVIGVTGPPGAGKSTLCAAIARALRARDESVGVVAVDPSSEKSGGALLGDRVRIVGDTPDPKLFVRSLAAGGELGGLARAAPACIEVLAAATDVVLVETVGVGQSEIDVANVADVTIVVVQPSSGDALQFLKAGIFEIPDVIVIGKSDLGDVARRAQSDLAHALGVGRGAGLYVDGAAAKVVLASGATHEGVDALLLAVDAALTSLRASGELTRRRKNGSISRAITVVERRVGELGVDALGGPDALAERIARALEVGAPPLEVAEQMVDEAIASLRPPR